MTSMITVRFEDFERIDMRIGKIVECQDFPQARKPAYRLRIDFGEEIGLKNSSAQLKERYRDRSELVGKKVVAVINLPPKQVANFVSEVLVLGVSDGKGGVILLVPDSEDAPLGSRVF